MSRLREATPQQLEEMIQLLETHEYSRIFLDYLHEWTLPDSTLQRSVDSMIESMKGRAKS